MTTLKENAIRTGELEYVECTLVRMDQLSSIIIYNSNVYRIRNENILMLRNYLPGEKIYIKCILDLAFDDGLWIEISYERDINGNYYISDENNRRIYYKGVLDSYNNYWINLKDPWGVFRYKHELDDMALLAIYYKLYTPDREAIVISGDNYEWRDDYKNSLITSGRLPANFNENIPIFYGQLFIRRMYNEELRKEIYLTTVDIEPTAGTRDLTINNNLLEIRNLN